MRYIRTDRHRRPGQRPRAGPRFRPPLPALAPGLRPGRSCAALRRPPPAPAIVDRALPRTPCPLSWGCVAVRVAGDRRSPAGQGFDGRGPRFFRRRALRSRRSRADGQRSCARCAALPTSTAIVPSSVPMRCGPSTSRNGFPPVSPTSSVPPESRVRIFHAVPLHRSKQSCPQARPGPPVRMVIFPG